MACWVSAWVASAWAFPAAKPITVFRLWRRDHWNNRSRGYILPKTRHPKRSIYRMIPNLMASSKKFWRRLKRDIDFSRNRPTNFRLKSPNFIFPARRLIINVFPPNHKMKAGLQHNKTSPASPLLGETLFSMP